jgi:hypothetical protein
MTVMMMMMMMIAVEMLGWILSLGYKYQTLMGVLCIPETPKVSSNFMTWA